MATGDATETAGLPSPKSNVYEATSPSESDEPDPSTEHVNASQEPVTRAVGGTLGAVAANIVVVDTEAPLSSVTVKVTVYSPGLS